MQSPLWGKFNNAMRDGGSTAGNYLWGWMDHTIYYISDWLYLLQDNRRAMQIKCLYFPTIGNYLFCPPVILSDWSHCVKTPSCTGQVPYCTRPGSKCWACAPCAPCHFMCLPERTPHCTGSCLDTPCCTRLSSEFKPVQSGYQIGYTNACIYCVKCMLQQCAMQADVI